VMKVSKEGKRFAIATFLIGVAALNTGNNLIYLIFSLMLSFIILSVVLGKANLSRLSLAFRGSPVLFAGEAAMLKMSVMNHKRMIPSYSVQCLFPGALAPAYFGMIGADQSVEKEMTVKFERRGIYSYGDFQFRSDFPFILLRGERSMRVNGELLVYPALRSLGGLLDSVRGDEGVEVFSLSASGDDVHSLREFRDGDDRRRIHWKASAKTGVLFVKEYADYEVRKLTVILDNLLPEGGELFERTVSLAASLAKNFLERGYFVRVVSCRKIIPFGSGEEQLFNILDILAVIKEEDSWDNLQRDSGEGYFVSILKSRRSVRRPYDGIGSKVIYAEDV
jgi:uncharacterized protein (DUF58 family)